MRLHHHGHVWTLLDESPVETWHTVVAGRFHVLTWQFGDHFHQAKVVVEYEYARDHHTCCGCPSIGVGLDGGKTQEEAMASGLAWVAHYQEHGPPTPDQELAWAFEHYPSLFKTRADVIAGLWFGSGGDGHRWLDGAIFRADQGKPPDFSHMEERIVEAEKVYDDLRELLPDDKQHLVPEPRVIEPTERPLPDDGERREWDMPPGGIKASRIWHIPSDLRHEWLVSCREAAQLLRDRSIDPEQAELGRQLYLDVEDRGVYLGSS